MNLTLFKADVKNNAVLWTIILYVMMVYFSIMAYMFDPADQSSFQSMMEMLPEGLLAGFGFDKISSNLTGFLVDYYYGFLVFLFPMIYCIVVSNRLVAKMVDNGSFAFLLMSPVSRRTIIITKGVFLLFSIALMFTVLHVGGVSVCRILFGDMLNRRVFLQINCNAALLTMLVGMICFFYSCYCNESRQALSCSAVVNIAFLLLFMLGGVSDKAEVLKKLSIFSLLDAQTILEGGGTAGGSLLLIVLVAGLFPASVFVFQRKNLPI